VHVNLYLGNMEKSLVFNNAISSDKYLYIFLSYYRDSGVVGQFFHKECMEVFISLRYDVAKRVIVYSIYYRQENMT
jgi:hypothetical protein